MVARTSPVDCVDLWNDDIAELAFFVCRDDATNLPIEAAELRPHAYLEEVCGPELYRQAGVPETSGTLVMPGISRESFIPGF